MKPSEKALRQSASNWDVSGGGMAGIAEAAIIMADEDIPLIELRSPEGVLYASVNAITGHKQIIDQAVYDAELSRFLREGAGQHVPH